MTKQEWLTSIYNSQPVIAARLDAVTRNHAFYDIGTISKELDEIIAMIRDLKRAFMFLKNEET